MNLWDVSATLLWALGWVLVGFDLLEPGVGNLGMLGGCSMVAATAATVRCIAKRHLGATTERMNIAFELGRDYRGSVTRLH